MLGNLSSAKMSSAEFVKLAFSSTFCSKNTIRIANNLDPDETPRYEASHLDPNCLQRPSKFCSSTERVKSMVTYHHKVGTKSKFIELISPAKLELCHRRDVYPYMLHWHRIYIQSAITPLLTDGVQCHLACIILLSIYTCILIPSFNEIRQSTSKIWLWIQKCRTDGRTDVRTMQKQYPSAFGGG